MSRRKSSAGIRGNKIRSDCYVELELKNSGGIKIKLQSKVDSMYGESIRELIKNILQFFGINHASFLVEDYGGLPFTIAARVEAAIKILRPKTKKEYLLPFNKKSLYNTGKDKLRRSRLYLPGNEPKYFVNAGLHNPDGLILDLEDSVAPGKKYEAKYLVRNALRSVDFYGCERMVRINQLPNGLDDLKFIVPHNIHVILIPKSEHAEQIKQVEREVLMIKKEENIKNDIYFMPIVESALGVIKAYEIASASIYNCALAIGLEDYTADIGTLKTEDGKESFFARSMVVNAARAAGIQPIDTVYSDVANMEGLKDNVVEAKSLGFEGKGCIHPRQVKIVHQAFAPTDEDITKAKRIVKAFEDAEKKGLGVVSIGSKMIDAPVVKRAQKSIELAILNNLLKKDWRKE
ncbi:MAG: HpcH/HpaI aldolase/citrate lyase family protein [Ignavibacteriaceae bacterium]|nr:HpcH/HpaI aldolase/citrate lyase family protein [Ignavibacteriaceae bacterium]